MTLPLIAIVIIGNLTSFGSKVSAVFSTINFGSAISTPTIDTLNISTAGEQLQFAPATLAATANQATKVTFKNNSAAQQHSWVLVKGGDDVAQKVVDAGEIAGAAAGYQPSDVVNAGKIADAAAGYQPSDPDIIANVKLLNGGETSMTASFTLPAGTYTYLCTSPGHFAAGMRGTLTVT